MERALSLSRALFSRFASKRASARLIERERERDSCQRALAQRLVSRSVARRPKKGSGTGAGCVPEFFSKLGQLGLVSSGRFGDDRDSRRTRDGLRKAFQNTTDRRHTSRLVSTAPQDQRNFRRETRALRTGAAYRLSTGQRGPKKPWICGQCRSTCPQQTRLLTRIELGSCPVFEWATIESFSARALLEVRLCEAFQHASLIVQSRVHSFHSQKNRTLRCTERTRLTPIASIILATSACPRTHSILSSSVS